MKICLTPLLLLLMSKVLCIHGAVQPSPITEVSPGISQRSARGNGTRALMKISSHSVPKDLGKPLNKLMKEEVGAEHQTNTPPPEKDLGLVADDPQTSHRNVKPGGYHKEGTRPKVLRKRSPHQTKGKVRIHWKKTAGSGHILGKNREKFGKKWVHGGENTENADELTTVPNSRRQGWQKWNRRGKTPEESKSNRKGWEKWDRSGNVDEENSDDLPGAPDDNQEDEVEMTDDNQEDEVEMTDGENIEDEIPESQENQNEDVNEEDLPPPKQNRKEAWKKWDRNEQMDVENTDADEEASNSRKGAWKKWIRNGKTNQEDTGDSTDTNRRKQAWSKWNRKGQRAGANNTDVANAKGERKQPWKKWKYSNKNM